MSACITPGLNEATWLIAALGWWQRLALVSVSWKYIWDYLERTPHLKQYPGQDA
jgi:hypothetical protein